MFLGGRLKNLKAALLKVLVFLLPTQLGYHFWPHWAYVFGIRIDYLSPTVYLTDIVIGALAFLWLFEKKSKKATRIFLFLSLLGLFASVNILLADLAMAALFKWLKVGELIFVAFIVFQDKSLDIKKTIVRPLTFAAVFVFLVAVAQVVLQRSVGGPLYFLGERTFNSGTPGISLYSIFGKSLLRPYSTFSHPNSMAGFAGVALLFLIGLGRELKEKGLVLYLGAAAFLGTLLLSGSEAAIGGLFLVTVLYVLGRERKELFGKILLTAAAIMVFASMLLPLVANKTLSEKIVFSERVGQRLVLADLAGRLYAQKPLVGLGLNNFIPETVELKAADYYSWVLQPVHNVPLLVLVETGMVGFGIFVLFLFRLIKKAMVMPIFFGLAIIFILITALVDHYWLTLQQNQLLLAVFIGIIFRQNKRGFLLN